MYIYSILLYAVKAVIVEVDHKMKKAKLYNINYTKPFYKDFNVIWTRTKGDNHVIKFFFCFKNQ